LVVAANSSASTESGTGDHVSVRQAPGAVDYGGNFIEVHPRVYEVSSLASPSSSACQRSVGLWDRLTSLGSGARLPGRGNTSRVPRLGSDEYFREIEQALLAHGRAAGVFSSTAGLGRARERLIADGLRPYLAGRVAIERGELVDSDGRRTGEVDTVLVDTHRGRIQVGGESLVPVEAAIAAVEVKSDLRGGNLADAVRKIARIKRLTRVAHHGFYRTEGGGPAPRTPVPPTQTFGIIIAFRSPDWSTIFENLAANPDWYDGDPMAYGPDRIVVLGRGLAVKNDFIMVRGDRGTENLVYLKNEQASGLKGVVADIQALLDRYGGLTYNTY
jgi:hypothetical protein